MPRDAYDVLHELAEAGTTLYPSRSRRKLTWECDRRRPVPTGLLAELPEHKAQIIDILLDVPPGCPVPHICGQIGICEREIRHSACMLASPKSKANESEAA